MRQARCASSPGLLLVEAGLSAVVIAVGLAFISRGLASHLRAIRTIEEQQVLLSLAHGTLLALEAELASGRPAPTELAGTFEAPYAAYRWQAAVAAREDVADADGNPLASDVTVTVERQEPTASLRLGAVWPREWTP